MTFKAQAVPHFSLFTREQFGRTGGDRVHPEARLNHL